MAPKDYGGLGIGSLKEANIAMLAKWWWRFKTETKSLWSIHQSSRLWGFILARISMPGQWKQVVKIGQDTELSGIVLMNLIRGILGRGRSISFWTDIWLLEEPLCNRFPNLFTLSGYKMLSYVSNRVQLINGMVVVKYQWSREPNSMEEMYELEVLNVELNTFVPNEDDDRWTWKLETSGGFTVRSLRIRLQQARFVDQGIRFTWNKWTPI